MARCCCCAHQPSTGLGPVSINLGREVATFPAFDDPDEAGAVIFAINQSRIKHGLPPHQWDFADLVALGVPRPIAEKFKSAENLLLRLHEIHAAQAWADI